MKRIGKALTFLVAILAANFALAAKDSEMKITFINESANTGYAFLQNNDDVTVGPIVERNGGSVQMSQTFQDNSQYLGMLTAGGYQRFCQQDAQGYLSLNPAAYKGDMIVISMTVEPKTFNLECVCVGSACEFSSLAPTQKKL